MFFFIYSHLVFRRFNLQCESYMIKYESILLIEKENKRKREKKFTQYKNVFFSNCCGPRNTN